MSPSADDRWLAGEAYDAYMGRWSRPLARAFVAWLDVKPGAHWLDVGCGTGALTSAICAACAPASALGVDPSAPFVDHARATLSDPRVTFAVAAAEDLPRRADGFDAAVSGLVLNFLPSPAVVVAALRERLRDGGVVGAYVWDYAEGMEFLRVFWDEAAAEDPRAAALDEGRRFPLCRPDALARLFEEAGLADVETTSLEIPTEFANVDDFFTPFLRGTGPAPGYVASLDAAARTRLRERLARRLAPSADVPRIVLRARAWAVRGRSDRLQR